MGFREISHSFRIFQLNSFSRKNTKFQETVCEMLTKIFAFCQESFGLLERP